MRYRKYLFAFSLLIIVSGILLTLYPFISKALSSVKSSEVSKVYHEEVGKLSLSEIDRLFEEASIYNEKRADNERCDYYEDILKIDQTGVIGCISIPKLDLSMNIYHSADMEILMKGIGHIPESSFPVPGRTVHAVLSGHTGLPTMTAFDDLDQMEIGDIFYIDVLNKRCTYRVDQIEVVLPEECSEHLLMEDGKVQVTLLTCTPYGVNTHRLLVKGSFVEEDILDIEPEDQEIDKQLLLVYIASGIISCIAVILAAGRLRKRKDVKRCVKKQS